MTVLVVMECDGCGVRKISAGKKSSRYKATKKVVSAASLPDMPVQTPLFVRDRCRYVRERCRSMKISCEFKKQAR